MPTIKHPTIRGVSRTVAERDVAAWLAQGWVEVAQPVSARRDPILDAIREGLQEGYEALNHGEPPILAVAEYPAEPRQARRARKPKTPHAKS